MTFCQDDNSGELERLDSQPEFVRHLADANVVSVDELAKMNLDTMRSLLDAPPGVYLNRAGTGGSKTTAAVSLVAQLAKDPSITTIYSVPTHKLARSIGALYAAAGISDGVPLPDRNAETCHTNPEKLEEADRKEELGLNACIRCELWGQRRCRFEQLREQALASNHKIMTNSRTWTSEYQADWLIVDEQVYEACSRLTEISRPQLKRVLDVLRYMEPSPTDGDEEHACEALMNLCELLIRETTRPGVTRRLPLDLPQVPDVRPVMRAWWWANLDAQEAGEGMSDGAAFGALLDVLRGQADEVWVRTATRMKNGRSGKVLETDCHLVVRTCRDLRRIAPRIVLLDATASPESLGSMSKQPIVEITPSARLAQTHPIFLFPFDDVSKSDKKSFQRLMSQLRSVILLIHKRQLNPRIGVIGHKKQIARLKKRLDPEFAQWVVRWSHFGAGDDRGDNGWYQDCTALVKLGTVRPAKRQIANHLIRIGRGEAAARDGLWGKVQWQDANGTIVQGIGYQDPDWRLAYQDVAVAADHQVTGRGRASLPDGIETFVLSSSFHAGAVAQDKLALVTPEILAQVAAATDKLLRAASEVDGAPAGAPETPCEHSRNSIDLREIDPSVTRTAIQNLPADQSMAIHASDKSAHDKPAHNSAEALARRRAIKKAVDCGLLERSPKKGKPRTSKGKGKPRPTDLALRIWFPTAESREGAEAGMVK